MLKGSMGRTTSPRTSEASVSLRVDSKRRGQGVMIDSIVFIDTSEEEKRSSSCLPLSLEDVCSTLSGKLSSECLPVVAAKKHSSEPPPLPERNSRNSFVRTPSFPITRCASDSMIEQSVRCALVGDSAVGKTSLMMSYTSDTFPETHNPTMYDKFASKFTTGLKLELLIVLMLAKSSLY